MRCVKNRACVFHLSELHGAATHLAVVAVPVYALVLVLRRLGRAHTVLAAVEPWALEAAVLGVAAAGGSGLLVSSQAETMPRGQADRVGTAHFWLGIALAVVLVGAALARRLLARRGGHGHGSALVVVSIVALLLVSLQGYLGGRLTDEHGVGVASGGQFAPTAVGAEGLNLALARGDDPTRPDGRPSPGRGSGAPAVTG